ncbi:MAG: EutN/CcmL family microcompartment protein [Verrucomicrobiae bacterium]|nr:EutN/CcmL family microcompartment protein [Verrucomicrobiae bacterium]
MILAKVEGAVVASKKNEKILGSKLLVVRPVQVDSADAREMKLSATTLVATDSLGAGEGELVLIVQGSSARLGAPNKDMPVDAVVIGIVDSVDLSGRQIYKNN